MLHIGSFLWINHYVEEILKKYNFYFAYNPTCVRSNVFWEGERKVHERIGGGLGEMGENFNRVQKRRS